MLRDVPQRFISPTDQLGDTSDGRPVVILRLTARQLTGWHKHCQLGGTAWQVQGEKLAPMVSKAVRKTIRPLDTALPPSGGSYTEGANVEWEDTAREGRRSDAGQELWPLEEASKSGSKSHEPLSSWRQLETRTTVGGPLLYQISIALSTHFTSARAACFDHSAGIPGLARSPRSPARMGGEPASGEGFAICSTFEGTHSICKVRLMRSHGRALL
jgi:hypothetical protein